MAVRKKRYMFRNLLSLITHSHSDRCFVDHVDVSINDLNSKCRCTVMWLFVFNAGCLGTLTYLLKNVILDLNSQ